jgi:hypothetical protein
MAAALSWVVSDTNGGVMCRRRKPSGTFRNRAVSTD